MLLPQAHASILARLQLLLQLLLALAARTGATAETSRSYKQGDEIMLYANKIGPFTNPTEIYEYYSLPFCQPAGGKAYKAGSMGELLAGNRLATTPYELKFRTDVRNVVLCNKSMSSQDLQKLRAIVAKDYYFQMFYDDLPVWGFVGTTYEPDTYQYYANTRRHYAPMSTTNQYYIFAHVNFDISYNHDSVIEIKASSDATHIINITTADQVDVQFSYSVSWRETTVPFHRRLERYTRFLPHDIEMHRRALMQGCIIVVVLASHFASILMRVRKYDNERSSHSPDGDLGKKPGEAGWKDLHGDVFRAPPHCNLFSAMMGVGAQVLVMVTCILARAVAGAFRPYDRGGMMTAYVALYALTSAIAGLVSGLHYRMFGGTNWVFNVVLCVCLNSVPVLVVFGITDAIALSYGSTAALPLATIGMLFLIWALVAVPLAVLGAFVARRVQVAELAVPCRTPEHPRPLAPLRWYRTLPPQMAMAGVLPLWTMHTALHYVFASVWGFKVFTLYSVLFATTFLAFIIVALTTIAITFSQLAAEDHRWWWRSFLCGGSAGLFLYGYCFFYFYARSDMNGLLQTAFFFGYNALLCYAFFLMLGSVGSFASHMFVRRMYRGSKGRNGPFCAGPLLKEPLLGGQAEGEQGRWALA